MKTQRFKTNDLRAALERGLGFGIASLERVGGGGALNFKAERAGDGYRFLVKCFPAAELVNYEIVSENLKAMEGAKVPKRIFETTCPETFAEHRLMCLEWRDGEFINLATLSDDEWKTFLDDYKEFSDRLQAVKPRDPPRPLREWRDAALKMCKGISGMILRPILLAMRDEDLECDPDKLRVVHGDFYRRNILTVDRHVDTYIDVESYRWGSPVEDIANCCLSIYNRCIDTRDAPAGRAFTLFAQAVKYLPYEMREWRTAFNCKVLSSLHTKTKGWTRMNLKIAWKIRMLSRKQKRFMVAKEFDNE